MKRPPQRVGGETGFLPNGNVPVRLPSISVNEYAQAYAFFCRFPSIKALAKAMGWSQDKAETVVLVGWPESGVVPLIQRYRELLSEALEGDKEQIKADMRLRGAEARAMHAHLGRMLLEGLAGGTELALHDKDGRVASRAAKDAVDAYEKLGRFAAFASGGPDSRVENVLGLDELANLMRAVTGEGGAKDGGAPMDVQVAEILPEPEPEKRPKSLPKVPVRPLSEVGRAPVPSLGKQGRWMGGKK
jgi:hypothetical protein